MSLSVPGLKSVLVQPILQSMRLVVAVTSQRASTNAAHIQIDVPRMLPYLRFAAQGFEQHRGFLSLSLIREVLSAPIRLLVLHRNRARCWRVVMAVQSLEACRFQPRFPLITKSMSAEGDRLPADCPRPDVEMPLMLID